MTDEHIINPTTSRPVRIGGKVYRDLVKKGIIEGFLDEKTQSEEGKQSDVSSVSDAFVKLKSKSMDPPTIAKASCKAILKNIDRIASLDEGDIESELEKLIIAEMDIECKSTTTTKVDKNKQPVQRKRGRPKKQDTPKYVVNELPDSSSDDDEDSD